MAEIFPGPGWLVDRRPAAQAGAAGAAAEPGAGPDYPRKIYVEATTACNLDCRMCVRAAWDEPIAHMSLELYRTLVDQISEFPSPPTLVFAGYGEPTCHPDILAMLELAHRAGARVEVVTNGAGLDAAQARALIDRQVDRVWFSIDGLQPGSYESIRRGGRLGVLQEHMRGLYRARLRARSEVPAIGLSFVAMRSNIADLPGLHRLAQSVHAGDVLISNVVAHTPEMAGEILYRRSIASGRYCRSAEVPRVHLPRIDFSPQNSGPLVDLIDRALSLELGGVDLAEQTNYCPFVMLDAAAIRWDGEVSPCPPLLHSHPVYTPNRRTFVRHAAFGNLGGESLAAIWNSEAYAAFRARVRAFGFSPCVSCGGCERSRGNEEDCYGNTFPVCGRCLWAQGLIRCP